MTVPALLHKKSARAKNFRNRFILLCVLTPVLAAVCVLLGVFTAPSNPVFIAVLVLSCVFVAVGTAYCCAEYASVKRFYALCSDAAFPCVVVTERRNLEFFEAEADDVRRYAELELKLNLALYKEQGRQGARVVSDAERKALKAQERRACRNDRACLRLCGFHRGGRAPAERQDGVRQRKHVRHLRAVAALEGAGRERQHRRSAEKSKHRKINLQGETEHEKTHRSARGATASAPRSRTARSPSSTKSAKNSGMNSSSNTF